MNSHRSVKTVFLVVAVALTMGSVAYAGIVGGDLPENTAELFEQENIDWHVLFFLLDIAGEDGEVTLEELELALDEAEGDDHPGLPSKLAESLEALRFEFEEDPEAVIFIEELVAKAASPISPPHRRPLPTYTRAGRPGTRQAGMGCRATASRAGAERIQDRASAW